MHSSHLCKYIRTSYEIMLGSKNIKNVFMKLRKIKNILVERKFLTLLQKNMDSSTSTSEANENVFSFIFKSSFVSFGVCIYVQYFCNAGRNQFSENYKPI